MARDGVPVGPEFAALVARSAHGEKLDVTAECARVGVSRKTFYKYLARFAEEGIDAGMSAIAERARVGVGTLYRRFPTKEALVEALMLDHMEQIFEGGEQAIRAEPDPWRAFVRYLRYLVEWKSRDEGLAELFAGRVVVSDEIRAAQDAEHLNWCCSTCACRWAMVSACSRTSPTRPT